MKSSPRQRRVRPLKAKAAAADAEFENYGAEPNMKLSHAFMVVLALHVIAVGGLFAFNKVKAGHSKVSQKLQTEVAAGQEAVIKEESKPVVPEPVHEMVSDVKKEIAKSLPQSERHLREGRDPASVATSSLNNEQVAIPTALPAPAPSKKSLPQSLGNPSSARPTAPALTAAQKQFLAARAITTPVTTASATSSSGAVAAVANMASSTAAPVAEPAPEPLATAPAAMEYTIVKGDNPYNIAKRFHVPYNELIKFNNISDPRKIQIGQKIRIPKKS